MKQGDLYIISTQDEITGEIWWRQEACMGAYWGKGNHIEVYSWIDQIKPWPKFTGSLLELRILAFSENRELLIHKVPSYNNANRAASISLIVRPHLRTQFALWRAGVLSLLRK